MPKKVRMSINDNANCNNCRNLKLRAKRFDFKKDINNPVKCHQWAKRFKLELKKEDKLNIFSEFHGFLTKVNGKLSKRSIKKINGRPLKCLNMNNSWNKKFGNNNNNNKNAMAVDFDHMYLDNKISLGKDIELQHLKELNILHLDIVQQQSEELIAKDKIIKTLQEENKNLRARLERIERRLALSQQKNELSPISVETDFSHDTQYSCCIKAEISPRNSGQKTYSGKSPICKSPFEKSPLYKATIEDPTLASDAALTKKKSSPRHGSTVNVTSPVSHILRASPRERRLRSEQSEASPQPLITPVTDIPQKESAVFDDTGKKTRSPISKRIPGEEQLIPKRFKTEIIGAKEKPPLHSISDKEKPPHLSISDEEKLLFHCTSDKEKPPLHSTPDEGLTDHSLRSRDKHTDTIEGTEHCLMDSSNLLITSVPTGSINLPTTAAQSEILQENISSQPYISRISRSQFKEAEARKVSSEEILLTNEIYHLLSPASLDFIEVLKEDGEQTQVEIPKWRIKPFTALYVMEGTENLEDEIFAKRHAKPEQDERRRKRWDLQRMREQRQYEKLRERYEGRNNANNNSCESQQSLWPRQDTVQMIIIDNFLPVCAFGQPLAKLPESDFCVPWLSGKSPLQVSARRRKR